MALKGQSLFLYNLVVTQNNSSLDFQNASMGPYLQATLKLGFYSLSTLLEEIARAMNAVDPSVVYVATANRGFVGGLQNRITIATSGSFLSLGFLSGPRTGSTVAPLLGFLVADYTGATTYQGSSSAGTVLLPTYVGYNFLSPVFMRKNFGSVNVSASGVKEAIVFAIQKFWQVQFKFEPEAKMIAEWQPLMEWMIQQRPIEFTPDVSTPLTFYEGTLEATAGDQQGMAYTFMEMLPSFPFVYDIGLMKFRQRNV